MNVQISSSEVFEIKDGIYIGDASAMQQLDLFVKHRIFHVVNCAASEIRNPFESIGVKYLDFYWKDEENEVVLDDEDHNLHQIAEFINQARNQQEKVMIVSYNGKCRSSVVTIAYLMKKYKWALFETLTFMSSKRPDLQLRKSFLEQLTALEKRLFPSVNAKLPVKWKDKPELSAARTINVDRNGVKPHSLEQTFSRSFYRNNREPTDEEDLNTSSFEGKSKDRVRFNDSELLFPTAKYSATDLPSPKNKKSILKKKEPDSLHDATEIQSSVKNSSWNAENLTPSSPEEREPKATEQTRPFAGITKPFPSGTMVTLNSSGLRSTRLGFNYRAKDSEQIEPKYKQSRFDTGQGMQQDGYKPEQGAYYQPAEFSYQPDDGVVAESNVHDRALAYNGEKQDKSFLSEIQDSGSAEQDALNARPDPVETFYGKSFLGAPTRKTHRRPDLPTFNTRMTQNYSNLYQESFLPDIYTKYKPLREPVSDENSTSPEIREASRGDNESSRSRNPYFLDRAEPSRVASNRQAKNNSMIDYSSLKDSRLERSAIRSREYNSDTTSLHTDVDRLLIRDKIRPELEQFRHTRNASTSEAAKAMRDLSNPSRSQIDTLASHVQNTREHRSISVPISKKRMQNNGYHGADQDPRGLLQGAGMHGEDLIAKLEPKPKPRAEFRRTFLSTNAGMPHLQRAQHPSQQNAVVPNPTTLMKSKYGAFNLGENHLRNTQKTINDLKKPTGSTRQWTIFDNSSNLYYPVNAPTNHSSQDHSPGQTQQGFHRGNVKAQPPSDKQVLHKRYEEIQYINKVFKKEETQTENLYKPITPKRAAPNLAKKEKVDYNMMMTSIYKDKKGAGMFVT